MVSSYNLRHHQTKTDKCDSVYCNGDGVVEDRCRDGRWIDGYESRYRLSEPRYERVSSPDRAERRQRESERAWRNAIEDDRYINYPSIDLRDPEHSSISRRRRRRDRDRERDADERLLAPPRSPPDGRRRHTTGPYRSIQQAPYRERCARCDGRGYKYKRE